VSKYMSLRSALSFFLSKVRLLKKMSPLCLFSVPLFTRRHLILGLVTGQEFDTNRLSISNVSRSDVRKCYLAGIILQLVRTCDRFIQEISKNEKRKTNY